MLSFSLGVRMHILVRVSASLFTVNENVQGTRKWWSEIENWFRLWLKMIRLQTISDTIDVRYVYIISTDAFTCP